MKNNFTWWPMGIGQSIPFSLKAYILLSAIAHLIVILFIALFPALKFRMNERPTRIIWVELPRGTSQDIELGLRKSKNLPRSTIEEQKKIAKSQETKKDSADKMTVETKQAPPKKEAKKLSPTDRKIAEALAMLDKKPTKREIVPEAAQIQENGEGYIYGTGDKPLRVMPSDPEYLKYQAMVRAKIINEWIVPSKYLEVGVNYKCSVIVMINMDGDIFSTSWEARSGDQTFDSSAMRAVQRATPLPKPPDRLAWEAYYEGFLVDFNPTMKLN